MLKSVGVVAATFIATVGFADTVFYQHARNAVLTNDTKGEYVLTMAGVDSQTLFYEDSFKSADQMASEKFFSEWATQGLNARPPIAAIITVKNNKSLSFKLMDPKYNPVKKTVHYTVDPIDEVQVGLIDKNWGDIVLLMQHDGNFADFAAHLEENR